jgi:hypothetical protein
MDINKNLQKNYKSWLKTAKENDIPHLIWKKNAYNQRDENAKVFLGGFDFTFNFH